MLGIGPARAQEDSSARAHFIAGSAHFETGNYEEARRSFEMAYQLSQRPRLLYNLYITEERLGHWRQAIEYLERYLKDVEDVPDRDVLEARLANLRRRYESREVAPETPSKAPAEPTDGEEPEGSTARQVTPPSVNEEGLDETAAGDPSEPEKKPNLPFIVSLAATGAAGASWGVFGALAVAENSKLSTQCLVQRCTESSVAALRRWSLLADISLGVTIAGAVASVVFALVGAPKAENLESARATRLGPWLLPEGFGLTASGTL